jgi:hypothetical protein
LSRARRLHMEDQRPPAPAGNERKRPSRQPSQVQRDPNPQLSGRDLPGEGPPYGFSPANRPSLPRSHLNLMGMMGWATTCCPHLLRQAPHGRDGGGDHRQNAPGDPMAQASTSQPVGPQPCVTPIVRDAVDVSVVAGDVASPSSVLQQDRDWHRVSFAAAGLQVGEAGSGSWRVHSGWRLSTARTEDGHQRSPLRAVHSLLVEPVSDGGRGRATLAQLSDAVGHVVGEDARTADADLLRFGGGQAVTGSLRDPVPLKLGGGEQALHEQHVASETGSTAV